MRDINKHKKGKYAIERLETKVLSFQNIEENDIRFSKVKIYICHDGKNNNHTSFTRDVLKDMSETLYGIPIIGKYNEEKEDFESHNKFFKIDTSTGAMESVVETRPYGFIPNDSEIGFEFIANPETGELKEYLTVTGVLWTQLYEESNRVLLGKNNQSMEIEVLDGDYDIEEDVFEIYDAKFLALCILGEDVKPCFDESKVVAYSKDESFDEALNEMKRQYAMYSSMKGEDSVKFKKRYKMDSDKEEQVKTPIDGTEENSADEHVESVESVEEKQEDVVEEEKVEEKVSHETTPEPTSEPIPKQEPEQKSEPTPEVQICEPEEPKSMQEKAQESVCKFEESNVEEDNSEEDGIDIGKLLGRISELEKENEELKNENFELSEFKKEIQNKEIESQKNELLQQFSSLLPKEKIDEIFSSYESIEQIKSQLAIAYVDSMEKPKENKSKKEFSYAMVENKNKNKSNSKYAI